MNAQQGLKQEEITVGNILFYKLSYKENDIPKYFKCTEVDLAYGSISWGKESCGIAYVRKAKFIEKIIWFLFY